MKRLPLITLLILLLSSVNAQNLQQVTDNGNSTTKNISIGATEASLVSTGVVPQALNLVGKIKLLGVISAFATGADANQPTIYRSGINTGSYPFNNYDHLILQTGIQNRDILFLTGSTPTVRMLVTGAGDVGIGTATPSALLHIQKDQSGATNEYILNGTAAGSASVLVGQASTGGIYGSLSYFNSSYVDNGIFKKNTTLLLGQGAGGLGLSAGNVSANIVMYAGGNTEAHERLRITSFGNVGIGTTAPTEKLSVKGKIRAQEIKVEIANWPDYVFEPSYQPYSLSELEQFIKTNRHLPEIPSAKEVEANGLDLGEMNAKLLKKIEELTLHLIEMNKKVESQQEEINRLAASHL